MELKTKIGYFRKIYETLVFFSKDSYEVRESIASLRLLLIDVVGEEKQQELIKQWNE